MKSTLLFLFVCSFFTLHAQQFNYFEGNNNLPVIIDTANANNLWQIGQPNKVIFNQAYSQPNAIMTDTANDYTAGNTSSFTVELDMNMLWMFPYAIISWVQSMETDSLYAGGWIEASYDSGTTWRNIMTDQVYPVVVYPTTNVTVLPNGEMGYSGSFSNEWSSICFLPIANQNPPPPPTDLVLIRFNFFSDSTALPDEGWMIDNFEFLPEIIHTTVELEEMSVSEYAVIFPNPVRDRLNIFLRADDIKDLTLEFFDMQGKRRFSIDKGSYLKGLHTVSIGNEILREMPNLFLLRVVLGDTVFVHKIVKF